MSTDLRSEYEERHRDVLAPIAARLERKLVDDLAGIPRIDRISARAKATDRFLQKAAKAENSLLAYDDPIAQIQDQVAARVIVLYKSDVASVAKAIRRYYNHAEELLKQPESEWEFGYFGTHLILALPKDAVPAPIDLRIAPRFFELQIRTLFEHAWSEANHDVGYKSATDLTSEQKRLLAYTSAQAWGADRVFDELLQSLRRRT